MLYIFDDAGLKSVIAISEKVNVLNRQKNIHFTRDPTQEPIPHGDHSPWALGEQQSSARTDLDGTCRGKEHRMSGDFSLPEKTFFSGKEDRIELCERKVKECQSDVGVLCSTVTGKVVRCDGSAT